MTEQLALPLPATAEREAARRRVASRLQWACSQMPMTVAADDDAALALAELILRDAEGRTD